MDIEQLYERDPQRRIYERMDDGLLMVYFSSVHDAYAQAGIDPLARGEGAWLCPGLVLDGHEFQVDLAMTPTGQLLGSHFLLRSVDGPPVNEVDIFLNDDYFDAAPGRALTADRSWLKDYTLTNATLRNLTEFIKEQTAIRAFQPVAINHVTSLSQ